MPTTEVTFICESAFSSFHLTSLAKVKAIRLSSFSYKNVLPTLHSECSIVLGQGIFNSNLIMGQSGSTRVFKNLSLIEASGATTLYNNTDTDIKEWEAEFIGNRWITQDINEMDIRIVMDNDYNSAMITSLNPVKIKLTIEML